MKKITTTIFALMMTAMVFGQVTKTLQAVSYRGAFEPGVTPWTSGWTEFNPNSPAYTTGTVVNVTAAITKNTTWTSGNIYVIAGPIYVKTGATLTIQPGTVIKGKSTVSNSSLIIQRGAKIMAQGTASNPIVFTSDKTAGNRNIGDWGGVILLGKARINPAGGVTNIEGLAASLDNEYGGTDDNDNSGVMTYCRIEFAGYIFAPDKEINGLTFGGIGRGTTINHIQVSYSNDDSYEWFGGTVNATHLVAYRGLDDDFDTDFGYSGTLQFCLGIRDKNISDQSANSTSEGFESDNEGTGTDSTITPKTKAVFSNFTVVGPYRGNATAGNETVATGSFKFRRAMRIRRNSNLRVFNSVFTDFQNGIFIDGDLCVKNATRDAASSNALAVKSNVFASMKNGATVEANSRWGTTFLGVTAPSSSTWFTNNNNSYQASSNGLFVDNIASTNFDMDYRPASGSALESGADFTTDFIAERTRVGLGAADITIPTLEIASLSDVAVSTINVGAIANADSYIWSTNAKTGVTFVSGQGTTALGVSFATTLATTVAKPIWIACRAYNAASNVYSTSDTVFLTKNKPTFLITALKSNPNNNVLVAAATVTLTAATATTSNIITVASTSALKVGMHVRVVPGTTAGNVGTNNVITAINSATQFTVQNNVTTALTSGGVLRAYFVPQGTFSTITMTGVSNTATLVTVNSTTGLKEGMYLYKTAGTGTLKAGAVVAKVIDATTFVISVAPTVALSGATLVANPVMSNPCTVALVDGGANTSEFDLSVVATGSNFIGYKYEVPAGVRIVRAGPNPFNDYLTNRVATLSSTVSNIGIVFDAAFATGNIKVTPYNNAGTGTAFSIAVKKDKAGIFKVVSTGPAVKRTSVRFTASVTNGSTFDSIKWTIPAFVSAPYATVNAGVVYTTTDTLTLSFDSTGKTTYFKAGALKVELVNACGTGTAKTFALNATTTLSKNGSEMELKEIQENATEVSNTLSVYPNPNNGSFNISRTSNNTEAEAKVIITNILGQVVSTIVVPNNNGTISSEINANLSTGIYFVTLQIGDEVSVAKISVN